MRMKRDRNIGNRFLITALLLLVFGLCFGILASLSYLFPSFLKGSMGFISLRPMHVSSVMFWIILGATGCVYNGLSGLTEIMPSSRSVIVHWGLWLLAIAGIFYAYFSKKFGGREYWEFEPIWALPIALAWLIFIVNFTKVALTIRHWPVYVWMWMTGIIFFMFTFIENYLWVFPYFREHFVTDMTIQWKVNGSLVGAWNQLLYGTAFYLMDRIGNGPKTGRSKLAFSMFFLGLFNLMFNWGHHIYTLPTAVWVRYVGYGVSMTEWVFFIKIIYTWRKTMDTYRKQYYYYPYRFLIAADIWVFINMGQAILMSIPAINIYSHGTHITVAHAMGTTIGINSMILLAACFEFLYPKNYSENSPSKFVNSSFWLLQLSLLLFWLSLNLAGVKRAIWQMSTIRSSYSEMMVSLHPFFVSFFIAGLGLVLAFLALAFTLLKSFYFKRTVLNLET